MHKAILWLNLIALPLGAYLLWQQAYPLVVLVFLLAHGLWWMSTLWPNFPLERQIQNDLTDLHPEALEKRQVWLTIDDGPTPEDHPEILDLLDQYQARATFFFIGKKAQAHPQLVQETLARGHTIANHTWSHPHKSYWGYGLHRSKKQMLRAQEALESIAQAPVTAYRSPAGLNNPFVLMNVDKLGYQHIGWTARGYDAVSQDRQSILQNLRKSIRPGAIILIHQGYQDELDQKLSPDILEGVLQDLETKGLTTCLPELTSTAAAS